MVGRAVFVLILIFVLNFVFVGLGLGAESDLNTVSPIDQDITTISDNANKVGTNLPSNPSGGSVFNEKPSTTPDSGDMFDNYSYIKENIGNFVWGYKNVFINIGLPSAFVFLFTGIMAIIQMFCLFIIISALISAFTGGGGV